MTGSLLSLASLAQALPEYGNVWRPPSGCNKYYTSGNGHHFCVIHDMEGYYYTAISYLDRCDISASIYYAVNGLTDSSDQGAPPGEITQCVLEANYAWHVGCWNLWMFGTEHEGFASNPAWYTEAMYQASAGLQKHLCNTYGIPKDRNHIIAHGQKLVSGWCTWLAANYPSINCTCNSHTDPGPYWDWNHFMALINGTVNSAAVAGSSVPSVVQPGANFTATVTMNNNGGTAWSSGSSYSLGSQSPQDNTTWGFGRVALPSSPISAGQNATFTINATAPTSPGAYTFAWRMVQDGVEWFGDTFSTTISVASSPQGTGTAIGSYTFDTGNAYPTTDGGWPASGSACGVTFWYSYTTFTDCSKRSYEKRWVPSLPTYGFAGRGHLWSTTLVPSADAWATAPFKLLNADGSDQGTVFNLNECSYSCTWPALIDADVNLGSGYGGWRHNTYDSSGNSCGTACGGVADGVSQMHQYGARWHYINDWTCLGGYGSGSVSDTANRSFAWGESGLYLYPAVDTTHGNVITAGLGLSGKTPGRVTTGDCNNANSLDFKGNANAYGGGDNMDAYGFAWMYSPAGAGPQFMIGSDDGARVWINGNLKDDNDAARGLTRDQDNTGGVGLSAGWNRILFKVHNFGGGFNGTVSLRNGGDTRLNEPSVNVFDLGGYYSYGIGYEQDAWYPFIDVGNFYGGSNPQPNADYYGNNTTVTASGTASNNSSPVPLWKVMHFEWGYGISGDSNYADVTSSGTSWSHTATGVTGHRRFHFFAVSQSGRTSFQNSGRTGGWNWADGGPGNYMDVFVDNLAPQSPSFSSVSAASASHVSLAWAIPLDQGVGIGPDATEALDETSNSSGNYYRAGDVGVQVYREGTVISSWTAGGEQATALDDTDLTPNSSYTYTIEARDNNSEGRGAWHNATGQQGATTVWTLSVPPGAGSVTPDNAYPCVTGSPVTWTAAGGFGAGQIQKYKYAWDQSPTHTWSGAEPDWSSGTLQTSPSAEGTWYLHVKGYNGANVENGAYAYAVTVTPLPVAPNSNITSNLTPHFSMKVKIAPLLAAWTSPGDSPLSVASAGPSSGQGGTVSKDSNYIYYVPPSGTPATDTIPYTVSNANGCTTAGTLDVHFVVSGGMAQAINYSGGAVTINFAGIPGYQYQVERSSDSSFTSPEVVLTTNAPSAGLFIYTDNSPPQPTAYYRMKH